MLEFIREAILGKQPLSLRLIVHVQCEKAGQIVPNFLPESGFYLGGDLNHLHPCCCDTTLTKSTKFQSS